MVEPTSKPPLPQTNDPWQLLGVSTEATLRDLKQAYARLIKIYRPDRAPLEFQRIHAAFELLREQLAPSGQSFRAAISDIPRAAPRFELASPAPQSAPSEPSSPAAPSSDREPLGLHGARWRLQAPAALMTGDWAALLRQAEQSDFQEAAESDASLREALWLPLTVAAWDQPESYFERFAWLLEGHATSDGARAFRQACQLRQALEALRRLRWLPTGFTDLVRLGRVGPEQRHELLLALEESLPAQSERWWRLCRHLASEYPLMSFHLLETLALDGLTQEAPVAALTTRQRNALLEVIEDAKIGADSLLNLALGYGRSGMLLLGVILLLGMAVQAYQAIFGAGSARSVASTSEVFVGVLVVVFVLSWIIDSIEDRNALRVIRKDLVAHGLGHQQLVDAAGSQGNVRPRHLAGQPALKLYLTLWLALQRSRGMRDHRSTNAETPERA